MSDITVYHNPRCSKSRAALSLLRERGADVHIVEYLETPPDEAALRELASRLGVAPRELLRKNETPYRELGLDDASLDDVAILRAIAAHPILLQRPIATAGTRALIARPPERVLELL